MPFFRLFTQKVFTLLALSLLVSGLAVPKELEKRSDTPGFLKLGFNIVKSGISKRDISGTTYISLINDQQDYLIDLKVGTPPQAIQAVLDTGSSDFWIAEKSAGGDWEAAKSTTYQKTDQPFQITYIEGPTAGMVGYDTVAIPGGPVLENFQFADITNNNVSEKSVLGVSYRSDESNEANPNFVQYPNFPVALKNAGLISKNVYSIYLNDVNSASGSIIFGGKDTAKYESLTTIPFDYSGQISLHSNSIITPDGVDHKDFYMSAVLDTGSTFMHLPQFILDAIIATIPTAVYNETNDNIQVSQVSFPGLNIGFNFSGQVINVPVDGLVTSNYDINGNPLPGYALSIQGLDSAEGYGSFGDSFLRSAYLVFDLDDNLASIGQAIYTTESNIVTIT